MGDHHALRRESLPRSCNACSVFAFRNVSLNCLYRYLVEGPQGAVLHTGDFRAEPWFLDSLAKEPVLQKYLAAPIPQFTTRSEGTPYRLTETLEAIYLDTACLLNENKIPTKVSHARHLPISLMLKCTHIGGRYRRSCVYDEILSSYHSFLHQRVDMGI